MSQKICVLTGASAGIGKETAFGLAERGFHLVLVCRDRARGEETVREVKARTGSGDVELVLADLSLMREVRRSAEEIRGRHPRIDVLLNNAGAVIAQRQLTEEGLETTFALNHLAYFLLTSLLLEPLRRAPSARIINVASNGEKGGTIDLDNLQGEKSYLGLRAYMSSKLANVMYTYALARRLAEEGATITANCLHPGPVASNFAAEGAGVFGVLVKAVRPFLITPEKGAQTSIHLASSPEVEGVSGKYFVKCRERRSSRASYDVRTQEQLWDASLRLLSAGAAAP
jgi:NAD(P)-dependent dehydrogenase (short-subunit alcohol dehydrogenase family)